MKKDLMEKTIIRIKSKISIDELLGLDTSKKRRQNFSLLMDLQWLDDITVLWELKYIVDNAYIILKFWENIHCIADNSTRSAALKEIWMLKDYINSDDMNILNFFKVDNWRLNQILAIEG